MAASVPGAICSCRLDTVERQVAHLTRLVDDLLDVARFVRGEIVLKKEVVALAELVKQVVESCRPLIESKSHQFRARPV